MIGLKMALGCEFLDLLDTMVHEGTSGGPVIDLETGYIFAIILVLTVLKLHKTDGDHLRKKV